MNVLIDFVHDMSDPTRREVRRLAKLPAPALLHIQSDLGSFIAMGGSGIVYEIDTPATVYDARGRNINIPPSRQIRRTGTRKGIGSRGVDL